MRKSIANNGLIWVFINSGLIQAGVYVVRPMVSYRALELGADPGLVGILGSSFAFAPLLMAIFIGRWVDKGFAGRATFIGSLILVLGTLGLIFTASLLAIAVCLPIIGLGHLLVMSGGQTLIAQRASSVTYERNFGLLTFWASAGHMVGPFIGGLLADRGQLPANTYLPLWFALGLFLLGAASVLALTRESSTKTTEQNRKSSLREVFTTPGYRPAIFVAASTTAVVDVMLIFLPVLGSQLGFTPSQVGLLLALRALSSMGVRLFLGRISSWLGLRGALICGSLLTFLGCLVLGLVSDFWLIALVLVVTGFAMGAGQPLTMAWVSRITKNENHGLAISMRLTANRLGQVAVPSVAGFLAVASISGVFFVLSALMLGAGIASWSKAPK